MDADPMYPDPLCFQLLHYIVRHTRPSNGEREVRHTRSWSL
jgi:hypothetical protein